MFLNLDAARGTRSGAITAPRERDDLARAITLKLDARLDGCRYREAGTGEELVAAGWIERPDFAGFIKCHELRMTKSAAFLPHLEIRKRTWVPLIHARVLTKHLLVHRAHGGSLKRRTRGQRCDEHRRHCCADR